MDTGLVSIIIPIYKVEEYISQCIDSVIIQSYHNLQIILVDDGSPDSCGIICDEYAKIDDRITVIHKDNGGLSDARNVGMEKATGEFVFFLDSDDYLSTKAIESLVNVQKSTEADIVMGNYWYAYQDYNVIAECEYKSEIVFSSHDAMKALMEGKLQTFAWGKLIRHSIAKLFIFPKGKLFEDHFWTHKVFHESKSIVYTGKPCVYYRQRSDSISYTFSKKRMDILNGWEERISFLEENYPDLLTGYLQRTGNEIINIAWIILTRTKNEKKECFNNIESFIKRFKLDEFCAGKTKTLLLGLKIHWMLYSVLAIVFRIVRR